MRSFLFVPADDERKLAKALGSGADALILDLEDSVAMSRKESARECAAAFIVAHRATAGPRLFVRVNPLTTGLTAADLTAIMPSRPAGIMQPKARSAADAVTLSTMIAASETTEAIAPGSTALIVLVTESAGAVLAPAGYDAAGPRLEGLSWGAEDLSADIGAGTPRGDDGSYRAPYALARSITILAAASARCAAIDTVNPDFRNLDTFRRDCEDGARDGFTGKLAIHPAQVPVINEVFTPSDEAIARARAVIAAFDNAETGVASLNGQMLDRPHLIAARRLLARI